MLIFNSLVIIFLTITFQQLPYGQCVDFVTPLIVAIGMTSTKKRALLWVLFMSIIWSPLIRFSFVLILVIWAVLIFILNSLSSKIRWDILTVGLFIAPITSFVWTILLLGLTWSFQFTPTLDNQVYLSFLLRPVSSGILTILFWNLLTSKTSSQHPLSRRPGTHKYFFTEL